MIEVTQEEAIEKIKTEKCVVIIWTEEGCPNCEAFEPILEDIQEELPHWNFYKIDISKIEDTIYFEPELFPTNFLFYKGERKLVAIGVAPKEEVINVLNDIFVGDFKTNKELEQEQLDALDE